MQRAAERFDIAADFAAQVISKRLVEISRRELQRLLQNIGCAPAFFVERQHAQNAVEAIFFFDELADLRGLKVSDGDAVRRARSRERRVQIADGGEATIGECLQSFGRPVIAPTLSSAALLED